MPSLVLRTATLDDLALLQHWDEQPHVWGADPHDDWGWPVELARRPDWREQLIAELDGRPIGFVQIIDPEQEDSHYWGDCGPQLRAIDLWIGEADCLGQGWGTQMMQLALQRCFAAADVLAVVIDPLLSNARAQLFYQRLGFEAQGVRQFGEDECLVMALAREEWQLSQG
jgi:aminoglycoside 6'-N-acetyltransferase